MPSFLHCCSHFRSSHIRYSQTNIYIVSSRTDDALSVEYTSAAVAEGDANIAGKVFFLKDHLNSITELVGENGAIIQRYSYSAYGKIQKITDAAGTTEYQFSTAPIKNKILYTAREFDPDTELYYLRARYYDTSIGRFLQQDPDSGKIGLPISHNNKYTYSANNPIMFSDPKGDFWFVGALLVAGISGMLGSQAREFSWDFAVAAVAVAAIIYSGGTAAGAIGAITATAAGSLMAAAAMAAFQGGSFAENTANNFHSIFRVSAGLLAAGALAFGVESAGATGVQGWIKFKNPPTWFPKGAITLGPSAFYTEAEPQRITKYAGVAFGTHEFGHTLQFIGLAAYTGANQRGVGDLFNIYLSFGALGILPIGEGWELFANWLGGIAL